jgi:hypothetical protein
VRMMSIEVSALYLSVCPFRMACLADSAFFV